MTPVITQCESLQLIGLRTMMTLADNRTRELWQQFMPRRAEISGRRGESFYSVQILPPEMHLHDFTPATEFEKWAAVLVSSDVVPPPGMATLHIPAGEYAVFTHRGTAAKAAQVFQVIYGEWMPKSGYQHDARPQFEIMPAGYKPDDPEACEDIWIPIKPI